ncbi:MULTISPECIES: VOC family protein [Streptomyces]|uniref:VOC family protein n=1 Tax=Streptomyces ochraceiscleroticus TaxID=47761 RepID=A0ABW1MYB7_9ACTN|nr:MULTISPECIES: VOC family protein [Streptomyces]MBZ4015279.1 glyoxalase/bleomycin resistance/dioxygenase family protein [Streptomyces purpurogeneiscleroticus]
MAIAQYGVVVLDARDPQALAEFYAGLLGWQVGELEGDWIEVAGPQGRMLAFQTAPDLVPPDWPSGERSQQLHLDFRVPRDRIEEAEREALELGAKLVQHDEGKRDFRVYLDPEGHPFCLCLH